MDQLDVRYSLIRADEAARVLSMSRSRVYALIADGTLPAVRVGKSVRISIVALERWIEDRTLPAQLLNRPGPVRRASAPRANAPSSLDGAGRRAAGPFRNSARGVAAPNGKASR